MTKRVQLLRHTAEVANQFLGLLAELTADTDNVELRLHDGVTPGGARFLNRDANDERYQARSVELDGLLGWEPNERGFIARLGPSTHRLRKLTVNESQLTVTNANGYDGNPLLGMAATITTDHTWSGSHTFSAPILATGGLVGNLTGDVTGNATGDHVGTLTGDSFGTFTGAATGTFTGDVDVSAGTMLMAPGQIKFAWLESSIIDYIIQAGVPAGTVVAFSGPADAIPANWFICDGLNGTPDLRERFIMGASATYELGDVGGAVSHSHALTVDSGGAHSHTGTVAGHTLTVAEIPSHRHTNGVCDDLGTMFNHGTLAASPVPSKGIDHEGNTPSTEGYTSYTGGGGSHSHGVAIDSGGGHSHTATSDPSSSHPPYYVLYYIMKGA